MVVTSSRKFLDLLEKSKLLPSERLEAVRTAAEGIDDPKDLARKLIKDGVLNKWQALQVLAGRYGLTLGKYKLLDQIDTGRTERVYLAEHPQMGRQVTIKTLSRAYVSKNPEALQRFLKDASDLASLDHRNIIHVYDIDSHEDRYFLVLEYVAGRNLQQLVEAHGPLPFGKVARYISQAATGLAYAHEHDRVHGDLRPGNLMTDAQDNVKILNLGLKRLGGASEDAATAAAGEFSGANDYISPEQALGQAPEPASDLYALGCVMYFLLTGHRPFMDGGDEEQRQQHASQIPPSIRESRPDAPPRLVAICNRLLAKKPAMRFASAVELAQAVDKWQQPGEIEDSPAAEPETDSPAPAAGVAEPSTEAAVAGLAAGSRSLEMPLTEAPVGELTLAQPALSFEEPEPELKPLPSKPIEEELPDLGGSESPDSSEAAAEPVDVAAAIPETVAPEAVAQEEEPAPKAKESAELAPLEGESLGSLGSSAPAAVAESEELPAATESAQSSESVEIEAGPASSASEESPGASAEESSEAAEGGGFFDFLSGSEAPPARKPAVAASGKVAGAKPSAPPAAAEKGKPAPQPASAKPAAPTPKPAAKTPAAKAGPGPARSAATEPGKSAKATPTPGTAKPAPAKPAAQPAAKTPVTAQARPQGAGDKSPAPATAKPKAASAAPAAKKPTQAQPEAPAVADTVAQQDTESGLAGFADFASPADLKTPRKSGKAAPQRPSPATAGAGIPATPKTRPTREAADETQGEPDAIPDEAATPVEVAESEGGQEGAVDDRGADRAAAAGIGGFGSLDDLKPRRKPGKPVARKPAGKPRGEKAPAAGGKALPQIPKIAYIIGGAVAGGLVLVTGLVLLVWFLFFSGGGKESNQVADAKPVAEQAATEPSEGTKADAKPETVATDDASSSEQKSKPPDEPGQAMTGTKEPGGEKKADDHKSPPAESPKPAATVPDEKDKGKPAGVTTAVASEKPATAKPAAEAKPESKPEAKPESKPETKPEPKPEPPKPEEKPPPPKPAPPAKKPFQELPKFVALPSTDVTDATEIGPLHSAADPPCYLELLGGEGIFPKHIFVKREVDAKNWDLALSDGESKSTNIAHITLNKDSRLAFQWLPEAKDSAQATFLRNCALNVRHESGDSKVIALRKPLEGDAIVLDPDKPPDRKEQRDWKLEAPPNPSLIKFTVSGPKDVKCIIEPASGANADKGSVLIKFEQAPELLAFKVETTAKKSGSVCTVHVGTSMLFNAKLDGTMVPLPKGVKLKQVFDNWTQGVQAFEFRLEQMKNANRGKKGDLETESLEKLQKDYKAQLEKSEKLQKSLAELNGKLPIRLRFYFETGSGEVDLIRLGL